MDVPCGAGKKCLVFYEPLGMFVCTILRSVLISRFCFLNWRSDGFKNVIVRSEVKLVSVWGEFWRFKMIQKDVKGRDTE
jgi:hypothetical protein